MALGRQSSTDLHSWPALTRLLRLQTRGKLRRSLAQLRNPQRAALSWFAFALLALFLTLELITLLVRKPVDPGVLMTFVPLGMLGICLLKLSRICLGQQHAGVELRPAEVIFLQGGPFTFGQVRAFKLVSHTISVMVTAAFASVFLWADVHLWLAGFLGAFSAMLFMYLLYMLVAVVAARVGSRTYNLVRAAFCLFVAATLAGSLIIALELVSIVGSGGATQLFGAWPWGLARLMQTPAGQVVLAPFNLFMQITLAADYRQLAFWLLPGCAINALLFWSILRAEGYMLKRNLLTEQQTYLSGSGGQKFAAANRGQPLIARQRSVPPLPWLAGAGPVAWRQLTAVRHSLAGVMLCGGLFTLVIASITFLRVDNVPGNAALVWFCTVTVTQLLLPGLLPFDFRRDPQEITAWKGLPISPRAIVWGQLLVPVAIATTCQAVVTALAALLHPEQAAGLLIGIAYFIPANLLIFGLENLAFLLYPYRITSFDMHTTARRAMMLFAKMLVLLVAFLLAGTIALLVIALATGLKQTGVSLATVKVCSVGLLLVGWWLALAATWQGLLQALCWAYRRFDPSIDRAT